MDPASKPLLEVKDLHTHFDTDVGVARAVDGISFAIEKGKCLAIVGESGCGKSVTSLSIMRLLPEPPARIAGGGIFFDGKDLTQCSQDEMCEIRGSEIAMIFQEPQSALNPVFTIADQVSEAYLIHNPGTSVKEAWDRTVEALRSVGISDPERRARDYPHQLSGGMRQRVCIAMALICNPQLIIADEPTTALDVTIQAQILDLLLKLQEERNLALLLITHDLGVVAEMAQHTCVMYAGKIVESAPTTEIFATPRHPYTQGLMRARPEPGSSLGRRKRLAVIPGIVPPATQFGDDCRFRPRCPLANEKCAEEPPLDEHETGHRSACWHHDEALRGAWTDLDAQIAKDDAAATASDAAKEGSA